MNLNQYEILLAEKAKTKVDGYYEKLDENLTKAIISEITPYFKDCIAYPDELAELLQFFGYSKLMEIISRAQIAKVSYLQRIKQDAESKLNENENYSQLEVVKQAMASDT